MNIFLDGFANDCICALRHFPSYFVKYGSRCVIDCDLQTRNQDLEKSLLGATSSLAEQEERMKLENGRKESGEILARKVEELKKSLIEKDLDNSSLCKQVR